MASQSCEIFKTDICMVVGKNTPGEHAPLLGPLQIKKTTFSRPSAKRLNSYLILK